MNIRPYRSEDRSEVAKITGAAWAGVSLDQLFEQRHGTIENRSWAERKTASVLAFCDSRPSDVLVAQVGGQVVGYASFDLNPVSRIGTVLNNAVAPEFRRQGMGSAMHRAILDLFRTHRMRIARVSTLEQDTPARRMYENHGFREIARTVHFSMDIEQSEAK